MDNETEIVCRSRTAETIDFRPLKIESAKTLPLGHVVREMLQKEPDTMPKVEGMPKLQMYIRLLFVYPAL